MLNGRADGVLGGRSGSFARVARKPSNAQRENFRVRKNPYAIEIFGVLQKTASHFVLIHVARRDEARTDPCHVTTAGADRRAYTLL